MSKLDKSKIPQPLHHLITIAEEWGINDDFDREEKLSRANEAELQALISSIDDVSDEDLFGWLEGPESFSSMPSDEYAVFTCLTMAIDSAKIKLERCRASGACGGDAAYVGAPKATDRRRVKFDEIGYWSELKLEIIESYALEYSRILTRQPRLSHVYIDGFSGAGEHISKTSGGIVPGSPLNAVNLDPPFEEYYLIDLDGDKVEHLRSLVGDHGNIHVFEGDCNGVLLQQVFPNVLYEDYRRGLCLLDPYGLQLDWEVIAKAGEMQSIEIFLNFPIMDMNRNVLWRDKDGPTPEHRERMTRFWGDGSWVDAAYHEADQLNLFGAPDIEKQTNDAVVEAFRTRLKKVAGFEYVPPPVPMRNTKGAVVYYLFFASHNNTGDRIVTHIFNKYRDRRS